MDPVNDKFRTCSHHSEQGYEENKKGSLSPFPSAVLPNETVIFTMPLGGGDSCFPEIIENGEIGLEYLSFMGL